MFRHRNNDVPLLSSPVSPETNGRSRRHYDQGDDSRQKQRCGDESAREASLDGAVHFLFVIAGRTVPQTVAPQLLADAGSQFRTTVTGDSNVKFNTSRIELKFHVWNIGKCRHRQRATRVICWKKSECVDKTAVRGVPER